MCPKCADGMANSVDTDQTAPRRSLIWVYTVCPDLSVGKHRIIGGFHNSSLLELTYSFIKFWNKDLNLKCRKFDMLFTLCQCKIANMIKYELWISLRCKNQHWLDDSTWNFCVQHKGRVALPKRNTENPGSRNYCWISTQNIQWNTSMCFQLFFVIWIWDIWHFLMFILCMQMFLRK